MNWTFAQVSHGGSPLFLDYTALRSTTNAGFIEMPAFNLDSALRLDEINKGNMRSSFQFAHKFYTHIEKGKDGNETVLADGAKVWQVGIRSAGAYSINLLFTEFHIPEGGKLFIYNTDHSHVIGSFDHRNNSIDEILPVRPVDGEAILVEYSEPADAAFEGKLVIGEVNHDYRGILRREPDQDTANYFCMPDVLCEEVDESMIRPTVLVMINGTGACSGTLINNTENDGTPYLLTAVHCLNSNMSSHQEWDHYINIAGTIVTFFNYNRPVCETSMKATEELTLSVAHPRVIMEKRDIALLELQEKPPVYYNAYYAGWNVNSTGNLAAPYTNIHHPAGAVKKYGFYADTLRLVTFSSSIFERSTHWRIPAWTVGSTHGGSSGSPLFDKNHLIVGGLSGGNSVCNPASGDPTDDFFFALYKGWENPENATNQLKTYLDPKNTGVTQWAGFDPNKQNPVHRISNARYNDGDKLETKEYQTPHTGYLFGNSDVKAVEFAEEFNLDSAGILYGAYLFIPPMPFLHTAGVEIQVYEGTNAPEKLIATQAFKPQYWNYSSTGKTFNYENKTLNKVATENLVVFDQPVNVNKKFYVAYKIPYSTESKFVVYNTQFASSATPTTAWIKNEQDQWTRANQYTLQPVSTALAVQPVVQYTNGTTIPAIEKGKGSSIYYLRNENRLMLSDESPENGQVDIYDVSGRLLQQIPVRPGQNSVVLRTQNIGSVGIVRVVRGNDVYTGKFIY
ncbi:hypothetical protein FACS189474_1970 [Bacteroidia bacterium]|nr:hypothetical protein FACS189474_1970 [Bacteroidia bacterium]